MKATIYTAKGTEAGSVELPESVFGLRMNAALLHQVTTALQANARPTVAQVKGRGEVRGGGKKPWKQKGTGRARHGSIRSPIWRGGGTTHGPSAEKNYTQKINRSMAAKALGIALSQKSRDGRMLLVDEVSFSAPKAKEARELLTNLGSVKGYGEVATRRKNAVLVVLPKKSTAVEKSFQNFGNVAVSEARNINVADILKYRYLVLTDPKASIETLTTRVTK